MLASPVPGRVTFLIRGRPGARFRPSARRGRGVLLVLEGDITFDTLTLHAGDYHVAHRGSPHPKATTKGGCLLLMSTAA